MHNAPPWNRASLMAAATLALSLFSLSTRAADAGDIEDGQRLFLTKGGCQGCHGWAGDGRKTDNQQPDGANLRETLLDREIIILTIKCGRPGRSMPAYDRLAYSDGRCYGMKQADLKNNPLPDPPATLQLREIERIVDFLYAKVIKQGPMTLEKCMAFWGADVPTCAEAQK
jgi:hypothetical protein